MSASKFAKEAHTTRWIPVKDLSVIWLEAQRGFDEKHAERIAAEFDPDMFGTLSVTLPNGNGIYHLLDGQHRKRAVQSLFGDKEMVPCNVFDAEDPARAAEIFDKINTGRLAPRPVDKFRVRVTAGYPTEVAVNAIVEAAGYRVAKTAANGNIQAVSALVSVYNRFGSGALQVSLATIRQTFSDDRHAVNAAIIRSYGGIIAGHPKINKARLVDVIQREFSPGRLLGRGKTLAEMLKVPLVAGIMRVIVQAYNHKLKTGALPEGSIKPHSQSPPEKANH